jgi:hypothetical protein
MSAFHRRNLIKSAAALSAIGLSPRLALGQATTPPKRFIVFFSANGTAGPVYDAWKPVGTAATITSFGAVLAPLTPFIDRVVAIDGLRAESCFHQGGDDHSRGMVQLLTATEATPGNSSVAYGEGLGSGGGPSIDQAIAGYIGTKTTFKSLELGVLVSANNLDGRMIYADRAQPLPPQTNPVLAYSRVFGGLMGSTAAAHLLKRRQSVLDGAIGTLNDLAPRLDAADRARLASHLDSVRQLEKQLVSSANACTPPAQGATLDSTKVANFEALSQAQINILVAAFACDSTRVASLQYDGCRSMLPFPAIGISDAHHTLTHDSTGNAASQNKLIQINAFYAKQFAYLLTQLDAVKENNGSLLDNSLVMWVNELADSSAHSHSPMKMVLAGKAGGALTGSRYLSYKTPPSQAGAYAAIAHKLDAPLATFGNPAYYTGPLADL